MYLQKKQINDNLIDKTIENLNIRPGGIYVDGTLGGGGHSYEILKRSSPSGKLVATDLDDYAINRATQRLNEFDGRFTLVKDNFKNFLKIKEDLQIDLLLYRTRARLSLCDIYRPPPPCR